MNLTLKCAVCGAVLCTALLVFGESNPVIAEKAAPHLHFEDHTHEIGDYASMVSMGTTVGYYSYREI